VASAGDGFLNINSIPPSTALLDGVFLGVTPRVHVAVKPGPHTVQFVSTEQGTSKTVTVTVAAGEIKPAVMKLTGTDTAVR
jgi:hypothetical protein